MKRYLHLLRGEAAPCKRCRAFRLAIGSGSESSLYGESAERRLVFTRPFSTMVTVACGARTLECRTTLPMMVFPAAKDQPRGAASSISRVSRLFLIVRGMVNPPSWAETLKHEEV